jgi:serine/threonine protein kinase
VCLEKPYDQKSDVWALGVILYEMCCLKRPFQANNEHDLVSKILKCKYEPIPKVYSRELERMVKMCLKKEP